MTIRIGPLAGLDVDPLSHEPDLRPAFVRLDQRTLRLIEKYGFAGEFAQRATLDDQRSDLRWVADWLTHFSGLQINVAIRHTGRRVDNWQQPIAKVFSETEKALVAG